MSDEILRVLHCSNIFPEPTARSAVARVLIPPGYLHPGKTGGKFAVAGQQIAGASENFVLNY